jgi:hypothetical protein
VSHPASYGAKAPSIDEVSSMNYSRTETRLTNEFKAKNPRGEVLLIQEYTDFHERRSINSLSVEWIPGLRGYQLDSGEKLNQQSPTEYRVVVTGEPLTRL